MQTMEFAKMSSKVHCLLATIPEALNVNATMSDEHKADVENEMQIVQDVEDDVLLEDSLLGNKVFHGGETNFEFFSRRWNKN